jgi:predicted DNA-binding transcriptional regulator YafY
MENEPSISRFDRIIAILIQLQSKRVVRAQELADRFRVSLRTIYRDIRSLEASGVPIWGEAGSGYSLMEGYRLPPVMFTKEEAASFIAAEKLMQQFTDRALGASHESAMYKLKSVLKGQQKDWIDTIAHQVMITPNKELFNEQVPDALEILFESLAARKRVYMEYKAFFSEEPSVREMEPVGLFHENNHWYIMAFCLLRNDYRQFRTDRIVRIRRTDHPFEKEHPALETLRKKPCEEPVTRIRIRVQKHMARYLQTSRKFYGFESEIDMGDSVEMTFMTPSPEEGFPRWFLMFGDYAEIIEPETLKVRVREILKKMADKLE